MASDNKHSALIDTLTTLLNANSDEKFDLMQAHIEEIENQIKAVTKAPVLEVKILEAPVVKLKQRANKHLAEVIINSKLGLNTMLIGPAGCGKTTLADQVATSLKLEFDAVCLTAGASETWLFGRQTPTGFIEGPFSRRYREGGVFLCDEMDAADANLLLSINTALSHTEMLNPMNGERIKRHKNFIMIAAANTVGKGGDHKYTGRTRLDAATLDRFVPIAVDYDQELELELCPNQMLFAFLIDVRVALKKEGYDEVLSTRAFITAHKRVSAGVKIDDVVASIGLAWSDAAKEVLVKVYSEHARFLGKTSPGEDVKDAKKAKARVHVKASDIVIKDEWSKAEWPKIEIK